MSGWTILSVVGPQTYDFPANFTLGAASYVDILSYAGATSNPPAQLSWAPTAIWNNAGDEAQLRMPNGQVVASQCCSAGCGKP